MSHTARKRLEENAHTEKAGDYGLEPWTLALQAELTAGKMPLVKSLTLGGATVKVRRGQDTLWLLVQKADAGGFALRTACAPGSGIQVEVIRQDDRSARFRAVTVLGEFEVDLGLPAADQPLLHWTVTLTPTTNMRLPFWPRDFYPLSASGEPSATEGVVHASQRGLNSGIVYLSLAAPCFGSALYFQNLTALNPYFEATETLPDGCVGGRWPELGYQPPTSDKPLPRGKKIVLSDAFLHWTDEIPQDQRQAARLFLDLLAGVYRHLDRPGTTYHDWPRRAGETARDLQKSPDATLRAYGNRYLHPYTAAEYPDSMVQLTVLLPLREYAAWKRRPVPLADELRAGIKRFFDDDLCALRRYLPNVGDDKDADEVDSWYLYHPLANLGRLAGEGDEEARTLFLQSLEYGIKVARHFKYVWPVQFNVRTLEVITGPRQPGEPGQSDTGGLYAYVMLQAYTLTGEERYLAEAKKAVRAVKAMEFQLEYQANITAWGANACLWLWKITGTEFYREQSYVFLASFFHNCLIWESQIGTAKHYPIFLGVTCLHDGPYMALYECFESYASFHEYLAWGGDALPASVRLLLTEFCRHALSRAWYYYPKELPKEALATEVRNGHIDRRLAFPLEDLYADGQPAGQVGQEIYGCGAAFALTTRAYHRLEKVPFLLYCEYPIFDIIEADASRVSFQVRGAAGFSGRARLIPRGHKALPPVSVQRTGEQDRKLPLTHTEEGHWEFAAPAAGRIELRWDTLPT